MIIRAIDVNGDWTFGKGGEDYLSANNAVAQLIQTRLLMFLGDCFFAPSEGVDWWNLLGGKNQLAINLAVNATILGTDNVLSLVQSSITLDATRNLSIVYTVTTAFTGISVPVSGGVSYMLTEQGDFIDDESGDRIAL